MQYLNLRKACQSKRHRKSNTYARCVSVLADEKVISEKLLREWEGMVAFRNVLVHDYLKIDHDKVYAILHDRLPYLEKLGTVFGRLT